jgi:hypothetical protein
VYGLTEGELNGLEATVNVKVLRHDPEATWQDFEEGLKRFGPEVLLIPE